MKPRRAVCACGASGPLPKTGSVICGWCGALLPPNGSPETATVAWSPVPNATAYKVYRSFPGAEQLVATVDAAPPLARCCGGWPDEHWNECLTGLPLGPGGRPLTPEEVVELREDIAAGRADLVLLADGGPAVVRFSCPQRRGTLTVEPGKAPGAA